MSHKALSRFGIGLLLLNLLFGCTNSTTATDPNAVVTLIASGVHAAGNSMIAAHANKMTPNICDVHGYPDGINQSDEKYPGYLSHCFMTVDAGDTVLGGFATAKNVSCMLNLANLVYDGVTRVITVTSEMASACNMPTKAPGPMQASVTASSPSAFNSNYSHGVVMDLSATLGLTFKIATNVSGTSNSFLTSEAWSEGSIGTTAGKLDTATGDLWYESRVERNNCTTPSRCGWNRHTRIRASLVMTGSNPTGLNSASFGYSNIQFTPGQDGLGGIVVTANGDLTNGIKSRLWQSTHDGNPMHAPSTTTDYDVVGNWAEVTNSACFTSTSETATTCGTGLDLFSTNTKFLLNESDSHMSVANWVTNITGQTNSAVNMDQDTQF